MEFNSKRFQDNIEFFRKKKGYTQAKLAELVGVDQYNIGRYETGHALPKIPTLIKIIHELGITMDTVFFYSQEQDAILLEPAVEYKKPKTPEPSEDVQLLKNYIKLLEKNLEDCQKKVGEVQ